MEQNKPKTFTFATITFADIKKLVHLIEQDQAGYNWNDTTTITLTDQEIWLINTIIAYNHDLPVHLLNEATIWARAIYPLLLLAETKNIRAWSEQPLSCSYQQFSVDGIVDGVLGKTYAGRMDAPYLVVVEAKRGTESQNPVPQSYGQILAAARLNWEHNGIVPQVMFGCYTIADSWTFIRAEITNIDTDKPVMQVETSREYVEKVEAATIVRILKRIVATAVTNV